MGRFWGTTEERLWEGMKNKTHGGAPASSSAFQCREFGNGDHAGTGIRDQPGVGEQHDGDDGELARINITKYECG
jgi:hypothetical protein